MRRARQRKRNFKTIVTISTVNVLPFYEITKFKEPLKSLVEMFLPSKERVAYVNIQRHCPQAVPQHSATIPRPSQANPSGLSAPTSSFLNPAHRTACLPCKVLLDFMCPYVPPQMSNRGQRVLRCPNECVQIHVWMCVSNYDLHRQAALIYSFEAIPRRDVYLDLFARSLLKL